MMEQVDELMREYMTVLLERMKKPETPLLEINDGIRLITMHFVKIRNADDSDKKQLAQTVSDIVRREFSRFCNPTSDPIEKSETEGRKMRCD